MFLALAALENDNDMTEMIHGVRRRFGEAVMDFTPEEREVVLWMIGEYRKSLVEEFPLLANQPWQVIKVRSDHCAGFCHTRGLSVVIAEGALNRMVAEFQQYGKTKEALAGSGTIIVHEQIHVLQRCFPKKFAGLYTEVYGFIDGKVKADEWVERNEIQNPDGLEGNRWIIEHEGNHYWLKTILAEEGDPARMPDSFREAIIPLQEVGGIYRADLKKGEKKPLLVDSSLIKGWKEQFPIRFGHDYPNEIFAYLFQAEMTRRLLGEEPSDDVMTSNTMKWARKNLK